MNSSADGVITVRFRSNEAGGKDYATISTIPVYQGSTSAVEIDASKSRFKIDEPTRFTNVEGQGSHETALGRLGSRFRLNLLPQKLGARLSSLGDGTGDLSDLVLGLTTNGTDMRCLPFTDRNPVWDQMDFKQTMTSQTYTCSTTEAPGLSGLKMTVTFRSPFCPGMEKLSSAPFFCVDVTVENTGSDPKSASFVFARPHSGYTSGAPAEFADVDASGDAAFSKIGYPYVWGGETDAEGGYDCSGLTYYVLQTVLKYPMQRVADDQARDPRYRKVGRDELLPGDPIYFFRDATTDPSAYIGHAGIYVGQGLFIHSTGSNAGVSVDYLSGYWSDHFACGKRVIQGPKPEHFEP